MPNNKKEKPEDSKPTKRDAEEEDEDEELAMTFQQKLSMFRNLEKRENKESAR